MIRRTIAIVAAAVLLAVPAAAAEAAAPGWGALVEGGGLLAFAGAVYHLLHRHLGEIVTDRRAAAAQRGARPPNRRPIPRRIPTMKIPMVHLPCKQIPPSLQSCAM